MPAFFRGQRVRMTVDAQRRWASRYPSVEATVLCVGSGECMPSPGYLRVLIDGRPIAENWLASDWEPIEPEPETYRPVFPLPLPMQVIERPAEHLEAAALTHFIVRE